MKKILFFLLIALAASTALFSQAQNDIRARRVIANEQVLLRNYRVDTITNDTTGIAGAEKTLMTAGAIFDFVNGRTLGGGGGGSYTFPYSVVAPGNAIQLENDTSAAAPGYFYGFNENGRRGFEVPKNIYNSDGTLTGNRTVDFNNNNLNFTTGSGELRINQISAGDYSTAKVQINNQTQFGPYLQVGNLTGNSAANVLYVFFRSNDTATISNIASHKARLFQANRDIVLGEGGVNISDKSGSASNLIFRLRDTVTLLPQGSDLVYGQRSGLVFVKNADYSGRSIVRSGNGGIAFDASAAHLSTVELPHTGGGGGNYYLKGYYAANVGYLYGNNASGDTIENYMGFYSTGSNNQRVLRAYNFFGTGIGPNIDSVWGIYQTQEHYNYLSSRLKIGGSTNRFSPDYNGVADSTLDVRGGAVITGGLKLTGIPYDAGLYSVRIDGSGNISYYDTTTGGGTVTSVGLSMPSAFNVSGSPVTGAGTLSVTGAGSTSQYIRGDGTLSTFLSDVRNGISLTTTGSSGAATYNSGTGVFNIPQYGAASGNNNYIQNQYTGSQAADYYVTGRFRRENSTGSNEYVRENMNNTIAGYELEVKDVPFEDRAAKFKMQWTTSENMIVLEAGTASAANNRITVGKDGMKIQPSYSDAAENFFGENSAGFITKRTAAQTRGDISAQAGIQFKDEGSNIGTSGAVTNVNYVGAGVTATHSSGTVTVTIPGGMTNPMTTEGDLIVGGSSGTPTRLAIGTNNYVLKSNGTTASWQPESGGGYTNLTQFVDQTAWRLFYSNGSGDVTELALGSSGTVLTSNGATSAPSFETPSGGVSFGSSGQIPYTNSTTDDFDYSSGLVYSSGNLSVGGNIGTAGNYEMQRSASNDHVRIGYDATNSVWSLSMRKDWESFNRGVIEWGGGARTTPALSLGYNFEYDAPGNHIMTIGGVEKFRVYPVGVSVSGDLVAGFSPTVQGKITSVASSGNQFAAHYSETIYSTWKTTSTGEVEINAAGSSPIFNFLDDVKVPDEAYGSGWNGSLEVPTKNAVYDKIESLSGGTPGGADKEFQFNQGGIFQGSAMLTQETDQVLVTSASDGSTTPLVVNGQEGYTGYLTDFSQSNVNRLRIHSSGYVDIQDISAPGTPASGYGRLYVNSDKLGFKNDAGTAYVVVGEATTQTLTNKRITKRITSEASSATPTINTDNADIHKITALATDITSMTTNLSGSPNEGDDLEIWITGTATRNITWGASFVAGSSTPPTATNGTATLKTVWNRNSSAWVFKGMY